MIKKTSHWKKFHYYNAPKFWKLYTQQLDRFLNNNFICKCMLLISPYTWSLKQTHVNKIKIYIIRFSSTFLEKQFTVSAGRSEFYKKAVVFTASGAESKTEYFKGKECIFAITHKINVESARKQVNPLNTTSNVHNVSRTRVEIPSNVQPYNASNLSLFCVSPIFPAEQTPIDIPPKFRKISVKFSRSNYNSQSAEPELTIFYSSMHTLKCPLAFRFKQIILNKTEIMCHYKDT